MTKKKAVKARKRSPRGKGRGLNAKAVSARTSAQMKELWKNPEFREKMRVRNEWLRADRKAHPEKYKRTGVPDGMRRPQSLPLWARARELADRFIKIMKDKGELPDEEVILVDDDGAETLVKVPTGDAGKAEAALREAFVLAVGPSDQKIKIQAINTVLNFTKSKPETKSKLTLNKAEDFLDAVAQDMTPRE